MATTVPIDILLGFLAGELCALMGQHAVDQRAPWGRPFGYALAFAALVFYPIGLLLLTFYPAWSWMYFLDPGAHSPLLGVLAAYCYVLATAAGYAACAGFWRGPTARRAALLVPALLLAGLMIAGLPRLWAVGSFDDFINGRAAPLPQSSLAWVLAAVTVAFLLGLATTLRGIGRLTPANTED